MTRRFAIYAAPGSESAGSGSPGSGSAGSGSADPEPADAVGALLRTTAEQWLGRGVAGDPVAPGTPAGWTRAAIDAITVDARRYGFHATLKPPFRLAAGRTLEELDAALARFAAGTASAVIPRLSLARLGGFFALVPGAEAPELHALADETVRCFDDFRAPPTDDELARRERASLSPRQRELLKTWGYPYVFDEFGFHLTLTDRIQQDQRPRVEHTLRGWFAPLLGATVPVDALALFTEAEPGAPFTLHALHRLRRARPAAARHHAAGPADREGAR